MDEENKRLRCVKRRTVQIEEVIEAEGKDTIPVLHIENINLNGKNYNLDLYNQEKDLVLNFNGPDYQIRILDGMVKFSRGVHRLNHDHDNVEYLQIVQDETRTGKPKGTIEWRVETPLNNGWAYFSVDFGGKIVNH